MFNILLNFLVENIVLYFLVLIDLLFNLDRLLLIVFWVFFVVLKLLNFLVSVILKFVLILLFFLKILIVYV